MKKIRLSDMSTKVLDKNMQAAIIGGGACVCCYICDGCSCHTSDSEAVGANYSQSASTADNLAGSNNVQKPHIDDPQ